MSLGVVHVESSLESRPCPRQRDRETERERQRERERERETTDLMPH